LTGNFKLNLSYPCIDTVVFGLSKSFLVSHLRIGVRFTSTKIFDGQKLHHSINYNNTLSAYIGNKIIQKFPPDYLFNKYRGKQIDFCNFTNTVVSDSVIYAIGDSHWDMFSRRNLLNVYKLALDPTLFVNRILLSPVFENWDLYDVIKNET